MVLGLADIPSSASICRLATAGPCPHLKCPSMGSASRNINGDVLAFTRPVYLGARSPGMVPGPFGSVPELRTAPLPAPHARARSDSLSTNLERAPRKCRVGREPCGSLLRVEGLPSSGNPTPTEPSVRISRTGLFSYRFAELPDSVTLQRLIGDIHLRASERKMRLNPLKRRPGHRALLTSATQHSPPIPLGTAIHPQ